LGDVDEKMEPRPQRRRHLKDRTKFNLHPACSRKEEGEGEREEAKRKGRGKGEERERKGEDKATWEVTKASFKIRSLANSKSDSPSGHGTSQWRFKSRRTCNRKVMGVSE
jgi:hypothetical protein